MQASIIILDFKKSQRVLENVQSIQKQKVSFPFEIIVAVNAADAAAREKLAPLQKYPNVKLVFNTENLGYARGNNRAAAEARGKYLFIVNPDIIWSDPLTLQKLVDYLEHNPQVGIVGPKQINEDSGEIAMTVRAFPKLRNQIARRTWLRKLPGLRQSVAYDEMRHLDYNKTQPVDWLQSSFVVIRKELWDKLTGFDERYFIFMSDPDLCWRIWQAGQEVIYYPETTVHADGKRASAGGFFDFFHKWTMRQHLRDALKYHVRHVLKKNPRRK